MEPIRYLALGDSYTIGTGLGDEAQNFPSLLAKKITEATGANVSLVNLGVNGYTTADLIRQELPVARASAPEAVTVLIGANDIVQGSDEESYRRRLQQIYAAVSQLGATAQRVLSISVPDFSRLPGAAPFGTPAQLHSRLEAFNRIAQTEATAAGFHYADITDITRIPDHGGGWLAEDGLHPGPAQHRAIADYLWGVVGREWTRIRSS
ncbi:MAG TPA: SGNH/GDSL hydrolase family protein [Candidatus Dormibacteraeota bacterium]|nr:SGNH/GDSL hydrolase family protein [Candidatus Dormibacteraeota bacterium]